ncbi:MAG TPA: response regulator, partial [Burkholderiaceae bacterium]|nr:response regulator [Burkholderiaceae bacterium]
MPGWRILDRLKSDPATRHVPICVVSTDDARDRALQSGAIGFLSKPLQSADIADAVVADLHAWVERPTRRLLVVMAPSPRRSEIVAGFDTDVDVQVVDDAPAARVALRDADCVLVDAAFADFGPEDVLDAMVERGGVRQVPVVVLRDARASGHDAWHGRGGHFALLEATSATEARVQAMLGLHRSANALSDEERGAIDQLLGKRHVLKGKKALIVDDDMRNIFALATVLDEEGMVIVSADNGREAIRLVETDPAIDVVLMDIMMPEMDGIATMQAIRKLPRGRELPMVAVTAKAMKGDRQKCIEAGAWDYLSKPVDPLHLLAVLRGWLCR